MGTAGAPKSSLILSSNELGTSVQPYDLIFAGVGAAACLMLLELHNRDKLSGKSVLLIDPDPKLLNDKTFCFWARPEDSIVNNLAPLISHSWSHIQVTGNQSMPLDPFVYFHISSIDLYKRVKELEDRQHFRRLLKPVSSLGRDEKGSYAMVGTERFYGNCIFDSRTPAYAAVAEGQQHLFQSFTGWYIETEEDCFESNCFRMMDFDVPQAGHTQFIYVLPFSSNSALLEITRFGSQVLAKAEAEEILRDYTAKHIGAFRKTGEEWGCIPMSNARIVEERVEDVYALGARNHAIKPSTGYAFKSMYAQVQQLADTFEKRELHVKTHKVKSTDRSSRFAFYDALLLDILALQPQSGKRIFTQLYARVPIQKIMHFLDEKTGLLQEAGIFWQLPWNPFLKALRQRPLLQMLLRPLLLLAITIMLILLKPFGELQNILGYSLLILGLVAVGIPHGAVDHLLETGHWDKSRTPRFIFSYLLLMGLMGLLWLSFPKLALFVFISYSAWHFGQADAKQWQLPDSVGVFWGFSALLFLLGTHMDESNGITNSMAGIMSPIAIPVWLLAPWGIYALIKKSWGLLLCVALLSLASQLPLLFAFGLYFIGQHSISSWGHISAHLQQSDWHIWRHSLLFHLGAWLLLAMFFFLWPDTVVSGQQAANKWGIFFIFLACISFPHTLHMNWMYQKTNQRS